MGERTLHLGILSIGTRIYMSISNMNRSEKRAKPAITIRLTPRLRVLLAVVVIFAFIFAVQYATPAPASSLDVEGGLRSNLSSQPSTPALPYLVYGYITDGSGQPAGNCTVLITNENTTSSITAISDANGYYQCNLANMDGWYRQGERINVTVDSAGLSGWNATTVSAGWGKLLDVTIKHTNVPEFPAIAIPATAFILMTAGIHQSRKRLKKR